MPTTTRSRRVQAVAALCAFGLLAVACGGDDDTDAAADDTSTTAAEAEGAGGEFDEYCAATAELDSQESAPTAEQMEHIKDVRPDEIGEDVDFVADAIIAADGDFGKVFADPEVEERLGAIEDWEGENCESEEVAVPAEAQEYCEKAAELDQQEDFPEAEQLEELRAAAPPEIAEQVGVVVDAFIAADGDIGKAFADPVVEENLGAIEEYEGGVCGIGDDEDEDEGEEQEEAAQEPLDGAQVIEVSAVDYAFEGIPAEVPAGATSFRLTNDGEAAHEMFMARLGEGVDLDELLARDEEPSPEEAEDVGSTFAAPGEDAYLNVEDLTPGTYAVLCFIPGPENKSHYELGMKATFTVA